MRLLPFVCAVFALCLVWPAAALDLYKASVPLDGADEAARENAVTAAFGRVLAQVAGRQGVATLAQQPAGRKAAQAALSAFGTKTGEDGATLLEAQFDPVAVRAFLDDRRVAAPADRRPTLLLWLLLEGSPAAWVGADEPPQLAGELVQSAAARGLPLLLPLLDLDERALLPSALDPADPASVTALDTASARYRPDGVLFGRLREADGRWRADLRLTLAGREDAVWSADGDSASAAIDAALDRVAGQLAPAPVPAGPLAPVQITVAGIDDVTAYARVWEHLSGVPGLRRLRPVALGGGKAVFAFDLAGGEAALAGRVEPGAPLARVADSSSSEYRYQP